MVDNIEDMTFEDICKRVKSQYNDLIPKSAYSSPEKLSEALQAINEARGYRSRYNVRAYMVLRGCVCIPKRIFTVDDLTEFTGLPKDVVGDCIRRWIKYDFRYLTRLPKRTGLGGAYRYKLRCHGIETYLDLRIRISKNITLNRMRDKYSPKRADSYFFITQIGRAKGITEDDLPKLVIR
jgi:hypothetical protein